MVVSLPGWVVVHFIPGNVNRRRRLLLRDPKRRSAADQPLTPGITRRRRQRVVAQEPDDGGHVRQIEVATIRYDRTLARVTQGVTQKGVSGTSGIFGSS